MSNEVPPGGVVDPADPAQRGYLSIGEVLEHLIGEFPDVTISKIRFLESQGLLEPERTPSGYRKFYGSDLSRLRWILAKQRERYVPIKQLRTQLDEATRRGLLPVDAPIPPLTQPINKRRAPVIEVHDDDLDDDGPDVDDDFDSPMHLDAPPAALGEGRHPASRARHTPSHPSAREMPHAQTESNRPGSPISREQVTQTGGYSDSGLPQPPRPSHEVPAGIPMAVPAVPAVVPSGQSNDVDPAGGTGRVLAAVTLSAVPDPPTATNTPTTTNDSTGSRNPLLRAGTGASLTLQELATASGLPIEDIRLLEQFGLIVGRPVFSATYYDEDALVAANAAAAFRAFGVEPRHLRMYKTAADREATFFAQIVTPLLRRKSGDGRVQAADTLEELARLGEQLRVVALRQVLRTELA